LLSCKSLKNGRMKMEKHQFKIPSKYKFKTIEKQIIEKWKNEKTYAYDASIDKPNYSIDTPPPFTSGDLHMGHILNHTWIDIVARYKRMKGFNVYFPQGFDCHGLPTELKVEKEFKISKDKSDEFLKKCVEWTNQAIARMKSQFEAIGYSTDWDYTYRTMDKDYLKMVQESLLDFFENGWLFRKEHPIHWCVNCQTALAKQEVGYVDEVGKLWYIRLPLVDGDHLTIATTRPELMSSCVAVMVHPDDKRYYHLSGKKVRLPIFEREVPIFLDPEVDMEFGTGVVYVCTYGDETDLMWQQLYGLPVIISISADGKMTKEAGKYEGHSILEARKQIVEDLKELGLVEKIEEHEHRVIVHTERSSCLTPIEYLPVKQWFISVREFIEDIREAAQTMTWYPSNMIRRLHDWLDSLNWDWVISRQRVFGTPIPFWICKDCDEVLPAPRESLPLDPRSVPAPSSCPKCNGKKLDPVRDVCDCWIDSSITPLVISRWKRDERFFEKTYPSTLRPQGYEIIRTWAFYTIFRCLKLTGKPCFENLMINGMVAGPDGRKMSKSFGNIVAPDEPLSQYGADSLRQWAAQGTLGDDYPFNDKALQYSMRFNTKLWNACRFASRHLEDFYPTKQINDGITLPPVDAWILNKTNEMIKSIEEAYEKYEFHDALMTFRQFFWHDFCDDYLEAVKFRLYGDVDSSIRESAKLVLYNVILNSLKIFSPIAPFITERIFLSLFAEKEGISSINKCEWPKPIDVKASEVGQLAIEIISEFRNEKSKQKIALNAEVSRVAVQAPKEFVQKITSVQDDIKETLKIQNIEFVDALDEKSFQFTFEMKDHDLKFGWNLGKE